MSDNQDSAAIPRKDKFVSRKNTTRQANILLIFRLIKHPNQCTMDTFRQEYLAKCQELQVEPSHSVLEKLKLRDSNADAKDLSGREYPEILDLSGHNLNVKVRQIRQHQGIGRFAYTRKIGIERSFFGLAK